MKNWSNGQKTLAVIVTFAIIYFLALVALYFQLLPIINGQKLVTLGLVIALGGI